MSGVLPADEPEVDPDTPWRVLRLLAGAEPYADRSDPVLRCVLCGATEPDPHDEDCPWRLARGRLAMKTDWPPCTPACVLDRERADWKLWNEESEAQLAAAHDVIRKLRDGWTPETDDDPPVWYLESGIGDVNLQWDGTAPMSDAERAVLDAADATPTEAPE